VEGFADIEAFVAISLSLCAAIIAISGTSAAVVKFWRYAHRQSDENASEIDEFRKWLASDKRRIQELEEKQSELDEINKLQLKALFTLLGHEIDGNHRQQLTDVRSEINTYLIEK